MRFTFVILFMASISSAQNIATRILTPEISMHIQLNPEIATSLLFPSPISGAFGLGLVSGQNAGQGVVQLDHPDGSNVLVLHPLTENARVVMTVLLDGALYVFHVESGPRPDAAITFVKADTVAPQTSAVTPEEVKTGRPKYDPELLVGFERRGHDAPLLRKLYPDLYQGYSDRTADYTSDSGTVKTTVTHICRFSKDDAIVLDGTVQNETSHPINFDGRATTVQVANEVHPAKLTDCARPIPAGATVPIVIVIQGDVDGGRANLSIEKRSGRLEVKLALEIAMQVTAGLAAIPDPLCADML